MQGERYSIFFHRFAVIFSVVIVWIIALIITISGAYSNAAINTQVSCRTDRSGLISTAPWYKIKLLSFLVIKSGSVLNGKLVDAGLECLTLFSGELQLLMQGRLSLWWLLLLSLLSRSHTKSLSVHFSLEKCMFLCLILGCDGWEKSTGTYISVSRYASATPIPPSVLSRGIGWQVNSKTQNLSSIEIFENVSMLMWFSLFQKGFGILLCGFFGAGNATSVSV